MRGGGKIIGGGGDRPKGAGMSTREVIEANHGMAGLNEPEAGVRADVSGPAGHEDALGRDGCAHNL